MFEKDEKEIKILSWNIWYDGNFDEISKFLKSFDADIIGLQEVVPNDPNIDVISFLKQLGYQALFAPVLEIRKDGRIMSNAIFSKYPIIYNKTHVLSEKESRNALQADIKIGEKIFHVFNTHLLHTHQKQSEIQSLQVENLMKVLPKEKTIIMGDFNATPDSDVIQKISKSFINSDPVLAPTWSIDPAGCSFCNPQKVFIRLDYIFTSKDIKTNSPKVHNVKGSDHLPISVTIEI